MNCDLSSDNNNSTENLLALHGGQECEHIAHHNCGVIGRIYWGDLSLHSPRFDPLHDNFPISECSLCDGRCRLCTYCRPPCVSRVWWLVTVAHCAHMHPLFHHPAVLHIPARFNTLSLKENVPLEQCTLTIVSADRR